MMTVTDLAVVTGLGWDTVKKIIKARLEKGYGHPRLKNIRRLSIDEIYFGRHKKFYTLVIDLDTGQIVWVAKGRGGDALRPFWRALRLSTAKIEAVAMDMSAGYWAAVMEHLPEAAIVFDRFHIIKLMNEKLDRLRREMVNEASGPMKQTVKGIRYLLLMRRENVEEEKLPRLDEALKHNEPLFTGYLLKEALGLLWEQATYDQMRSFLHQWCAWADESGISQMRRWPELSSAIRAAFFHGGSTGSTTAAWKASTIRSRHFFAKHMVCVTSVTWFSGSSAFITPGRHFSDEPKSGPDPSVFRRNSLGCGGWALRMFSSFCLAV
jgi:transposase